jgi:hypothetical protein
MSTASRRVVPGIPPRTDATDPASQTAHAAAIAAILNGGRADLAAVNEEFILFVIDGLRRRSRKQLKQKSLPQNYADAVVRVKR